MDIRNSFSIASKDLITFKKLVTEHIEELGKPTLAILFVNADLEISATQQFMDQVGIPHIGASSAGEICNEKFARGMYSGLFLYLPAESFKIYHSPMGIAHLSGEHLGEFAKQTFNNPGIYMVIASKETQTDLYIEEIQKTTTEKIPLYGGYAFDNLKYQEYTVFSNNYLSHKGVAAVIFDCDQIEIHGDAYSGWDSMGTTHTITKSDKAELLEIDGMPAIDLFRDYFDYIDLEKVAQGEPTANFIGNHPIKIIGQNGATYLRSPIHVNLERKSLIFYCSVPEGAKFKFCNSPKFEITDNLIERIKGIKKQVQQLDCLLITSCASREYTLGPFFKKEVQQLFNIWEKPMAGFLAGGEIGNVQESKISGFHNVTCTFTGFKLK